MLSVGQDSGMGVFSHMSRFLFAVGRKYCLVFILQAVCQLFDAFRAVLALCALLLKIFLFFYYLVVGLGDPLGLSQPWWFYGSMIIQLIVRLSRIQVAKNVVIQLKLNRISWSKSKAFLWLCGFCFSKELILLQIVQVF